MPELTEEEADALDEYYTTHVPKTGPNGTGFISRRNARLLGLSAGASTPDALVDEIEREILTRRA
jgi:hypothetical protein